MKTHTHHFIQTYNGLGAFGMGRSTDEQTIMFYLQKFSEDKFMAAFLPKLPDQELENIYMFVNNLLKKYLTEDEYHELFLKDR